MPIPTADDVANEPLQSWDDVDRWLLAEAREHARLGLVPHTTAYVLHRGVTTLLIRPPKPRTADAHQVGAALAHMIHPLEPDQVLLTFADAAGVTGGDPIDTLQAMAGERDGFAEPGSAKRAVDRLRRPPDTWRHLRLPLPYDHPDADIALATIATPAPWTTPVQAVFGDVPPPPPDISKVHHRDAEFTIAVNPDGPAAHLASRWPG